MRHLTPAQETQQRQYGPQLYVDDREMGGEMGQKMRGVITSISYRQQMKRIGKSERI